MKKYLTRPLAAALFLVTSSTLAHTVWLQEEQPDVYRVLFGGHADALETYDPQRLISVVALDADGRELSVERENGSDGVLVRAAGKPAVFQMFFDNGIWSRDAQGRSVNQSMTESGAERGSNTVKYHKTIVEWDNDIVVAVLGQEFEVRPLSAQQPRAGEAFKVQVTLKGKPLEGVKLGHGEEGLEGVTDSNGIASFTPRPGFNRLWAGSRVPDDGRPHYTETSYEYLFGFTAR